MTTVEVSKPASKYTTITKTTTVSSVSKPLEGILEIHDPGVSGANGPPNVLSVGTVTSGDPAVVITGTAPSQVLNFVLPISGSYAHTQSVASATWTITHNLGYRPAVSVVDSGGNYVVGDVNYISTNALTISFSSPFGGSAYLS
jgi:hypothetical protein